MEKFVLTHYEPMNLTPLEPTLAKVVENKGL